MNPRFLLVCAAVAVIASAGLATARAAQRASHWRRVPRNPSIDTSATSQHLPM